LAAFCVPFALALCVTPSHVWCVCTCVQMFNGGGEAGPVVSNTACARDLRNNCNVTTSQPMFYGLTNRHSAPVNNTVPGFEQVLVLVMVLSCCVLYCLLLALVLVQVRMRVRVLVLVLMLVLVRVLVLLLRCVWCFRCGCVPAR
jgi:hypothetical protein